MIGFVVLLLPPVAAVTGAVDAPRRRSEPADAAARFPRSIFAVVSGVLYSNWLLASLVDPRREPRRGYVSELGARTAPHATLFNMLSILAGAVVLYVGARIRAGFDDSAGRGGALALAVVGIGTMIDGLLPMDCAPSTSAACAVAENAWHLSWVDWTHTAESVLTDGALLVALGLLAYALWAIPRLRWFSAATASVLAVLAVLMALQVLGVLRHAPIGANERWSLTLTSAWIEALVIVAPNPKRALVAT